MKPYIYLLFSIFILSSCSNDDNSFEPQNEEDILNYIEEKNLNASKTTSGLYYIIKNEGTGQRPTENSVVNIDYAGYYLDGGLIFEGNSAILDLSTIIEGLKEGIQLFKEGGEGTLIIPSELAYGTAGNSNASIPGGAVLVFDIKLTIADYVSQNETAILKYINDNNITNAIKSDSGLYYVINKEGTGEQPTNTSNVTVAYKGYFLDDTIFDQSSSDGVSFNLNQVIAGWSEGITYFKEGGEGTLLIPFNLGYGINGSGSIPGGEVLIFDVSLLKVN